MAGHQEGDLAHIKSASDLLRGTSLTQLNIDKAIEMMICLCVRCDGWLGCWLIMLTGHMAGISQKCIKLRPIGVIKG